MQERALYNQVSCSSLIFILSRSRRVTCSCKGGSLPVFTSVYIGLFTLLMSCSTDCCIVDVLQCRLLHCGRPAVQTVAFWTFCSADCCIVDVLQCRLLHFGRPAVRTAALWTFCSVDSLQCALLHCGQPAVRTAAVWTACSADCCIVDSLQCGLLHCGRPAVQSHRLTA